MGEEYVKEIEAGKRKDRLCWSWTMYCAGDGNSCQRECGNIGSCKENCANRNFPNNIKNSHDMHLCKVRVISESKLSWLKTSKPLRIIAVFKIVLPPCRSSDKKNYRVKSKNLLVKQLLYRDYSRFPDD